MKFFFSKSLALLTLGVVAISAANAAGPDPIVALNTSKGVIKVKVYKNEAPITAGNFLDLVQRGFYKNMKFHRVVKGFVIQTGDPQGNGQGGYIDPKTHSERNIPLEVKPDLKHGAAGALAMARAQDPNSASSQFYITLAQTPTTEYLDGKYAVFGRVVSGMDVVNKIGETELDPSMGPEAEAHAVKLISTSIVSGAPSKSSPKKKKR